MDENLQQNCPFDGQFGCWQGFSYRESGIEEKWGSERVANHSKWKICWSHSSNRTISTGSECCSSPALVKNQSIGYRSVLKVMAYPYIWSNRPKVLTFLWLFPLLLTPFPLNPLSIGVSAGVSYPFGGSSGDYYQFWCQISESIDGLSQNQI